VHTIVFACRAENVSDATGVVPEVIPRVVGAVDAIEDATAIRIDQPAQNKSRVLAGDLTLPGYKLDLALMFTPRTMLREDTWPVLPIRVHDEAARRVVLSHHASALTAAMARPHSAMMRG